MGQYIRPSTIDYNQSSALQYIEPSPQSSSSKKNQKKSCIECDEDKPVREYEDYINKEYIITFKCTLCDKNLKKKLALMGNNKDFHDDFYQSEKGVKRKSTNMSLNNKRFKSARGDKRKMNSISPPNKKAKTKIVVYEPYDVEKS